MGVFFDPQLNFNFHVISISSKLSKALYMLRSTKNFLPQKARKAVYYTLLHCHLIYCLPIWSCTSSSNLNAMSILQKKAVRIVASENYNVHTYWTHFQKILKSYLSINWSFILIYSLCKSFNKAFCPHLSVKHGPITVFAGGTNWKFFIFLRNENLLNIPFARLSSSVKLPIVS